MEVAAGIIIFLLIIAAIGWLIRAHGPIPTINDDVAPGFTDTNSGAPEGGTPAQAPQPGGGVTTQDTGGGPAPTKPV